MNNTQMSIPFISIAKFSTRSSLLPPSDEIGDDKVQFTLQKDVGVYCTCVHALATCIVLLTCRRHSYYSNTIMR